MAGFAIIIIFVVEGHLVFKKDELKLVSTKPIKVWDFPGVERNRFLIVANNVIEYCSSGNKRYTPSIDTLFYFLNKINDANFNIVRLSLSPTGVEKQDEYYHNFFKALELVNKKNGYAKLKCLVCDDGMFERTPEETERLLLKFYNREDVYGFNIDEPKEKDFKSLAVWSSYYNKLPQNHPLNKKLFYINLFGASSIDDYIHYVNAWITSNKPSLLSFDNYSVWDDKLASTFGDDIGSDWGNKYFYNFEVFRNAGIQNQLPFINWIVIHKHYSTYSKRYYRRTTVEDLRFQIYSALAYGSKGILYYNFFNPPPDKNKNGWHEEQAILDYNGKETELFNPVATINKEISIIGDVLLKLVNIGTYHNSQIALNSKTGIDKVYNQNASSPDELYGVKLLSKINQYGAAERQRIFVVSIDNKYALIGLFKNIEGNKFFVLVNMNRKSEEEFVITLDKEKVNKAVHLLNILTNKRINPFAFDERGNPKFRIKLSSGGGLLFGVVK